MLNAVVILPFAFTSLPPLLTVKTTAELGYTVSVGGSLHPWLTSAQQRAFVDSAWHTSAATGLVRMGSVWKFEGTDDVGAYAAQAQNWSVTANGASSPGTSFTTAIKTYASSRDIALFELTMTSDAQGTASAEAVLPGGWVGDQGNYAPIVGWPSFATDAKATANWTAGLAALSSVGWCDNFCYPTNAPLALSQQGKQSILGTGVYCGPAVLHDGAMSNDTLPLTLLLAPLDHVKHAGMFRNDSALSAWELGIYSEVPSLPAGLIHRTLLMAGRGVTATVAAYGELARRLGRAEQEASSSAASVKQKTTVKDPPTSAASWDVVVNRVGYWTDNGAFYYGDAYSHNLSAMAAKAGKANMEEVVVAVQQSLDAAGVPIGYWQWDDWWYPGKPVYVWCVSNWSMVKDQFPSGLAGVRAKLSSSAKHNMSMLYYMPYWCQGADTQYNVSCSPWSGHFLTQAECGWDCEFTFIHASRSEAFHVALFEEYTNNGLGLTNYEQDFMVTNFLKSRLYRTDLDEYVGWASGLNAAAKKVGVALQFCMAMPSDIMMVAKHSLEMVTNARASNDYAEGDNLIRVPQSGLLMWALGVRPSKDNFWSHNVSDSPYQHAGVNNPANPGSNCELNAMVATLSTGPVGISDKIGATNKTIVMATCDSEGRILQPSKPLTPSDRSYAQSWESLYGGNAQLWTTHADVAAMPARGGASAVVSAPTQLLRSWITLAVNVDAPLMLAPLVDLYPAPSSDTVLIHRNWNAAGSCIDGADAVASGCILPPNAAVAMQSTAHNGTGSPATDFHYTFIVTHVVSDTFVLLGELSKYVPISPRRFVGVEDGGRKVTLRGGASEIVKVFAIEQRGGNSAQWTVTELSVTLDGEGKGSGSFAK